MKMMDSPANNAMYQSHKQARGQYKPSRLHFGINEDDVSDENSDESLDMTPIKHQQAKDNRTSHMPRLRRDVMQGYTQNNNYNDDNQLFRHLGNR